MKNLYLTIILSSLLLNVNAQGLVDYYLKYQPTYQKIADRFDQVNLPTDLDFNKEPGKTNELWILNRDMEQTGGSTVTVDNPGEGNQSEQHLRDGNAWHFMALPSALSFGDEGAWGTSTGIYSANHNGVPFTGPSLWASDRSVYAQPSGGNGSHLDMLHQSPYCMGIEWEDANKYWVMDGQNGNIIMYDFQADHGPGNDYHGDAILRRYTEVTVSMKYENPGHLALDHSTGMLYIVDPGGERILKLDIYSGTEGSFLQPQYEPIASYKAMQGVTHSVLIDQGLTEPVGIAVADNRLMVSDKATGKIHVYDISQGGATEMGTINTSATGIMGITVGPNGRLWYVDHEEDEAWKINVPANLPPLANDDVVSTSQDNSVLFDILYNDMDLEGDTLSYSIISGPANGQADIQSDETIEYTPNSGWNGVDIMTYELCSSNTSEGCDTATVTINVSAIASDDMVVEVSEMLYPNPTKGRVQFTGDFERFEIYNTLGSLVKRGNLNTNSIDASDLNMGVYLFKLHSESGSVFTEEVVILD